MRIALISYEYPPDTHLGGIATYVEQAAKMLAEKGDSVEVFCATTKEPYTQNVDNVLVHRVHVLKVDRKKFSEAIVEKFGERHAVDPFDIAESPEYYAEGFGIKKAFPEVPVVAKFHTPTFLIEEIYFGNVSLQRKLKYYKDFLLYDVRYGKKFNRYWKYDREKDPEYRFVTQCADGYSTPSVDLGRIVSEKWNIPRGKIKNVPYPFLPSQPMLNIPITDNSGKSNPVVTFVGRLETRKGIYDLIEAIPLVLKKHPGVIFRFIGASQESIVKGMDVGEYLLKELHEHKESIQLLGKINYNELPAYLTDTDICIFPSIWENFPNVCLEAMSAGRAVIGSRAGGMADMIEEDKFGLLCNPNDKDNLVEKISYLIENPAKCYSLGIAARKKILDAYNRETIYTITKKFYSEVINSKKVELTAM